MRANVLWLNGEQMSLAGPPQDRTPPRLPAERGSRWQSSTDATSKRSRNQAAFLKMPLERESQSDTAAKPESLSETDPTSEHSSRKLHPHPRPRILTARMIFIRIHAPGQQQLRPIAIRHVDVLAFNKRLSNGLLQCFLRTYANPSIASICREHISRTRRRDLFRPTPTMQRTHEFSLGGTCA
jgi:hypothetical protein